MSALPEKDGVRDASPAESVKAEHARMLKRGRQNKPNAEFPLQLLNAPSSLVAW